jgi:hypothetical protein
VFQFRHDVRPVPDRKIRIAHLLDHIPRLQETEDGVTGGPVQKAYVSPATTLRNGAFNLVECDITIEQSRSKRPVYRRKSTLNAQFDRKESLDLF